MIGRPLSYCHVVNSFSSKVSYSTTLYTLHLIYMFRLSSRPILSIHSTMSKHRSFKSSQQRSTSDLSSQSPPGYTIDPSAGTMLRFQASLPRLPVPTLSSTLAKYLESVRPHLSPSAFAATQSTVSDFLRSPLAAELQERLQARASQPEIKNWLATWWNEVAYMGYRDPVVVFVSYFFVHIDDKLRPDQPSRAAALVKAMLPFRDLTESCVHSLSPSLSSDVAVRKQLEPEKVKGAPLCMDSYQWLSVAIAVTLSVFT